MITNQLKTILTSAGCTRVIYESDKIANLKTDQSLQHDIVGLIIQPNSFVKEVKANSILEHYPNMVIEILHQARLEDSADNNETIFEALDVICDKVILYLIAAGVYKKITPVTVEKVLETKYDANLIGWSMSLDLTFLENKSKNPCL
jgi:hypothetical protein